MPYRGFEDQNCSIAATLAIVGERWSLLVLREVLLGRRRFVEIKRHTGAASNIVSDRLHTLVEHGLLERRRHSEHADSFEYVPTARGYDIHPVLVALMQWGDRHVYGEDAAPRVIVHTRCGHDAHPRLTCIHCGRPVETAELRVRPGPGADERQQAEPLLPRGPATLRSEPAALGRSSTRSLHARGVSPSPHEGEVEPRRAQGSREPLSRSGGQPESLHP